MLEPSAVDALSVAWQGKEIRIAQSTTDCFTQKIIPMIKSMPIPMNDE